MKSGVVDHSSNQKNQTGIMQVDNGGVLLLCEVWTNKRRPYAVADTESTCRLESLMMWDGMG
jgi:hypothetical protein